MATLDPKSEVFHKPADYVAFLQAISESSVHLPMRLLAYCVMLNHFPLVVRPHEDGDLSLDAMADDHACAAILEALRSQRPRLAGTI